jgi:hypothetical protein
MKAKQARVECIQKTFLHRKSFFPSFCGVGPLVTENQTLWLPKSCSNPVQTCNKPIQGYLVELANSQNQIKLYLVKSEWDLGVPGLTRNAWKSWSMSINGCSSSLWSFTPFRYSFASAINGQRYVWFFRKWAKEESSTFKAEFPTATIR